MSCLIFCDEATYGGEHAHESVEILLVSHYALEERIVYKTQTSTMDLMSACSAKHAHEENDDGTIVFK